MQKFIEALETMNWNLVLDGAKKEASRQVVEMTKWLELQEKHNPEGLDTMGKLPDAIRKAAKYRTKIYNRNKDLKAIDKKLETETDPAVVGELQDKRGEYEAEQFMTVGRIFKIYMIVTANVSLVVFEGADDRFIADDEVYEVD